MEMLAKLHPALFRALAALFLLSSLTGCDCCKGPSAESNTHLIVFIDKTLSVDFTSTAEDQVVAQLAGLLEGKIGRQGDRVSGYYIHRNTSASSRFLQEEFATPVPDVTTEGGVTAKRLLREYEGEQQQFRQQCLDGIKTGLAQVNTERTSAYTDLWAALELMSRFFATAQPGDEKIAVFISDMVESMQGPGRRDFHRHKIPSKEAAEQMAREDAAWIQANLNVQPAHLAGATVKIRLPHDPMSQNDFSMLRYYWEALLGEVGVGGVEVE
jgi:hypothetical protein